MASTALKARSIQNQAQESAGQLGLGYAQLGQRAAASNAEQQMAAARIREAQEQQAGLQSYRDQLEQNREVDNARADELLKLNQGRSDLAQQREDRIAESADRKANADKVFSVGLDVVRYNPETGAIENLYRAKPSSGGSKFQQLLESYGGGGSAGPSGPKPVPSKKSDLVKGTTYQTKFGVAEWDGDKFVVPQH